jgi:hypothetical protein
MNIWQLVFKQLMLQDETAIVARAFQDGVNPAERIYAIAKSRGYKAAEEESPLASNENKQIMDKLDQLDKGIKNSRSLGNISGSAPTSQSLTLEKLAMMDDDDFDRNWNKVMKAG